MTLFEALTGGAFDRLNWNIAGNLTKIFQKSQMPGGLPGGGMGGFGIDRYITRRKAPRISEKITSRYQKKISSGTQGRVFVLIEKTL